MSNQGGCNNKAKDWGVPVTRSVPRIGVLKFSLCIINKQVFVYTNYFLGLQMSRTGGGDNMVSRIKAVLLTEKHFQRIPVMLEQVLMRGDWLTGKRLI